MFSTTLHELRLYHNELQMHRKRDDLDKKGLIQIEKEIWTNIEKMLVEQRGIYALIHY